MNGFIHTFFCRHTQLFKRFITLILVILFLNGCSSISIPFLGSSQDDDAEVSETATETTDVGEVDPEITDTDVTVPEVVDLEPVAQDVVDSESAIPEISGSEITDQDITNSEITSVTENEQSSGATEVSDSIATLQQNIITGSLKNQETYIVKKGDTLYSIGRGSGVNYKEIAKINKLDKNYSISPGQVLLLKSKSILEENGIKDGDTKPLTPVTPNKTEKDKVIDKSDNTKVDATKVIPEENIEKTLDPNSKSDYPTDEGNENVNKVNESNKVDDVDKINKTDVIDSGSIDDKTDADINNVVDKKDTTNVTLPKEIKHWLWPVKGDVIGKFSTKAQGRKGLKISGNHGDIIKAAAGGKIIYVSNKLRGYGNLVIIKHNDEYLSAYAHVDTFLVKKNQYVSAGQPIATMGSSGVNETMLHFEIRFHGKPVDPLIYLPKR